jgi:hypothetical protein
MARRPQIVAFGGGGFSMEWSTGRPPGDAVDDGAALHFVGSELERVVSSDPSARADRDRTRSDRPAVEGLYAKASPGRRILDRWTACGRHFQPILAV